MLERVLGNSTHFQTNGSTSKLSNSENKKLWFACFKTSLQSVLPTTPSFHLLLPPAQATTSIPPSIPTLPATFASESVAPCLQQPLWQLSNLQSPPPMALHRMPLLQPPIGRLLPPLSTSFALATPQATPAFSFKTSDICALDMFFVIVFDNKTKTCLL